MSTNAQSIMQNAITNSPLARGIAQAPETNQTVRSAGAKSRAYNDLLASAKSGNETDRMLFAAYWESYHTKAWATTRKGREKGWSSIAVFELISNIANELKRQTAYFAQADVRLSSKLEWSRFDDHDVLHVNYTAGKFTKPDLLALLEGLPRNKDEQYNKRGLASLVGVVPGVGTLSAAPGGHLLHLGKEGSFLVAANIVYDLLTKEMRRDTFQEAPYGGTEPDATCVMGRNQIMNGVTFVLPRGTTFADSTGTAHTLARDTRIAMPYYQYLIISKVPSYSYHGKTDEKSVKMHLAAIIAMKPVIDPESGEVMLIDAKKPSDDPMNQYAYLPADLDQLEYVWAHYFGYNFDEQAWNEEFFGQGRHLYGHDYNSMETQDTFTERCVLLAKQKATRAMTVSTGKQESSKGEPLPDFPERSIDDL